MIRVPAVPEKNIKNAGQSIQEIVNVLPADSRRIDRINAGAVRICAAAPAFISISFEQLPLSIFLLPERQPPGTDP